MLGSPRHGSIQWFLLPIVGIFLFPNNLYGDEMLYGQQKRLDIPHIDVSPKIDGHPFEPVWDQAALIDTFIQIDPDLGEPASQRTEVRVARDEQNLYLAFFCFHGGLDTLYDHQLARDASLDSDDHVSWFFDSFLDSRNGFGFQISAGGSRGDALLTEQGQIVNWDWDTVWEGRVSRDGQAWYAEVAIPSRSLMFNPDVDHWGFNVRRFIRHRNEEVRWENPSRDLRFFTMSQSGSLGGLHGLEQGLGVDVRPYFKTLYNRERVLDDREFFELDGGGEVVWRITPNLTSLLTFNTDFAETEVDDRRVNLTRFPLFFPEKREFFLEDAEIFAFGGLGRGLTPFFSRRIGLTPRGETVPVLFGGKVSGRVGKNRLAVLDAQTDSTRDQGSDNLFAGRYSRDILEESNAGVIVTRGNPLGSGSNMMVGGDFNYRTSDFLDGKNLAASVFGLKTTTSGAGGNGEALGASVSYPNDLWDWRLAIRHIDPEFNPAMGFVLRTGVRFYAGSLGYKPRLESDAIRQLIFRVDPSLTLTSGNDKDSWRVPITPLGVRFHNGSEFKLSIIPQFETFDEPFAIQDDVVVPGDDYDAVRYGASFDGASKWPVSFGVRFENGEFLSGHRFDVVTRIDVKPSNHFLTSLEYEWNDVDLDEGDFVVRILRTRFDINLSPRVTWSNYVQWDNVSDLVGINSRLRLIQSDGRELFLVHDKSWFRDGTSYAPQDEQTTLKLEYLLRF